MGIDCGYEPNMKGFIFRIEDCLQSMDCVAVPLKGTMVFKQNGLRCADTTTTVLIRGYRNPIMSILTKDENLKDTKSVNKVIKSNMLLQLLLLCCDKYATSKNTFTIECTTSEGIITLSCNSNAEPCMSISKNGVQVSYTEDRTLIESALNSDAALYSFGYESNSEQCTTISKVAKDKVKALRVASTYLGCALMFLPEDYIWNGKSNASFISNTGCIITLPQGNFKKVPITQMKIDPNSYIIGIEYSVQTILSANNIPTLMGAMSRA